MKGPERALVGMRSPLPRPLPLALSLAFLLPGCILEPGLDQSTTRCPESVLLETGFRLVVADPGRLVGRCVAITLQGSDDDFALRQLGSDGVAYLPIDGPGDYRLGVSVRDPNDKYCRAEVHASPSHPGAGLVEVVGEVGRVCA